MFQRNERPAKNISLSKLWRTLPEETRQRTLVTLSRIIGEQLQPPPSQQEVKHEDR